jgi:hypothetical protein
MTEMKQKQVLQSKIHMITNKTYKILYQNHKIMKIYHLERIEMKMDDLMNEVVIHMKTLQLMRQNEKILYKSEKILKKIRDSLDDYGKL